MESIKGWARKGEAVRQAIELGALVHMETASEEGTDEVLLLASASGLSTKWAETFPAPREEPEMGLEVIVPAPLAGRFAGLYSVRTTGYVLRSARVLGALGSSVEGLAPEPGWSVRGTSEDTRFRGDVGRQLVVKMEAPAALRQPPPGPAQEPRVVGKGRERVARRAVQQAVEEAEAAARALKGAEPWGRWDNPHVGVSMVK